MLDRVGVAVALGILATSGCKKKDPLRDAIEADAPKLVARLDVLRAIGRQELAPVTTDHFECATPLRLAAVTDTCNAWVLNQPHLVDPQATGFLQCAELETASSSEQLSTRSGELQSFIAWSKDFDAWQRQDGLSGANERVEAFLRLPYVVAVKTTKRELPKAARGGDFTPGRFEGEAHVIDLATRAECGAFRFTAESSDRIRSTMGVDEALEADLDMATIEAFNDAVVRVAPGSQPLQMRDYGTKGFR